MACLNVPVKNENQGVFMDPRISFSNDFIDSNHHHVNNNSYTEAPVSSDFEFSVPSFSNNEALCKGKKLLPLKQKVVTLREELLAGHDEEDDDGGMFIINNKNSTGWWREKFGLRKSQSGKSDGKNVGGLETIDEAKIKPAFYSPSFTGSNQYK